MVKEEQKRTSWSYFFGYILFTIVTSTILIEVVLSLFYPAPGFEAITITAKDAAYQLSPNKDLFYVPRANSADFNAHGYRGPLIKIAKEPGIKRIVCIGDSVVEGLGVSEEKRYSTLIRKRLGQGVEVVNLGVRGYNLKQAVEYFKEKGLEYRPDLVLVGITFNDGLLDCAEVHDFARQLSSNKARTFYRNYYSVGAEFNKFLFNFNLYRHIVFIRYSMRQKEENHSFYREVRYFIENGAIQNLFRELVSLSKAKGFKLLFLIHPPRSGKYREGIKRLRMVIVAEALPHIDLDLKLHKDANFGEDDVLLPDDCCHLSVKGHFWVADQIEPQVRHLIFRK